ncbi:Hypothetical predicted protein [Olea europaea subsp. europaea]|uniref:Uncharacterized protein n=1 Tax=Olea europaea subsp. europaea TaxID=158383 RepID=A0A8S0S5R4_OLEEU|nr:Hypothetical predicted protein [Olea europaea subsp. europaea]
MNCSFSLFDCRQRWVQTTAASPPLGHDEWVATLCSQQRHVPKLAPGHLLFRRLKCAAIYSRRRPSTVGIQEREKSENGWMQEGKIGNSQHEENSQNTSVGPDGVDFSFRKSTMEKAQRHLWRNTRQYCTEIAPKSKISDRNLKRKQRDRAA